MSEGRTVRRVIMAGIVVAAGGLAAAHPQTVKAFYQDVYPSDPAKRRALDLCFAQDHQFNRLDAGERDACYRHTIAVAGEASSMAARPEANPIDLQRDAGHGALPRNDIRRLEQTLEASHSRR